MSITDEQQASVTSKAMQLGTMQKDMMLRHKRLRHTYFIVLSKLFCMDKEELCKVSKYNICPYEKQIRLVFPLSSIKNICSFDLIHLNLWSPYKIATFDGNKYFFIVVDEFSRMIWVFLPKHRSGVCLYM